MVATIQVNGYRSKCWPTDFLAQLAERPEVRSIRARSRTGSLLVTYCTGIGEVYWLGPAQSKKYAFSLTPSDLSIQRVPPVYDQYPGGLGSPSPHPAHLTIQRTDWMTANQMERRLAVQGLIHALSTRGWSRPTVPQAVLVRDLARCRGSLPGQYPARRIRAHCGGPYTAVQKHQKRGIIQSHPNLGRGKVPGWVLTTHFFDFSEWLALVWCDPVKLYKLTRVITDRADGRLCTRELIRHACRYWGPRVLAPGSALALFTRMGLQPGDTILDICPGLGSRAIAASIMNLRYVVQRTMASDRFTAACDRGFADLLQLNWGFE